MPFLVGVTSGVSLSAAPLVTLDALAEALVEPFLAPFAFGVLAVEVGVAAFSVAPSVGAAARLLMFAMR